MRQLVSAGWRHEAKNNFSEHDNRNNDPETAPNPIRLPRHGEECPKKKERDAADACGDEKIKGWIAYVARETGKKIDRSDKAEQTAGQAGAK